ncbi:oligosaccharide flippase family protein [Vibrio alginolyticus]|uniref:oligosaccharide flippase family protein n=1 Tax=Vibrio TaxID=662 RepID=UPI00215B9FE5|nr:MULTISPECIES: oligosaccharide flippase family protein [Vibrio]EJN8559072.1 oligosaccharide flippase family protein [Vibrio alginolyticus]ELA7314692.1 oligosaccharide flippase family protein [Vibrio alginolyticus]ELB2787860.1 oligosaccharide flippase family protein [Vibrio alginolyticus]ELB2893501.1 oligosaccharide flippase family protein [Vibrio alginolyticus]MCR9593669.1 oligosaccharide flippase family protein [Vibrio alginolyticus]
MFHTVQQKLLLMPSGKKSLLSTGLKTAITRVLSALFAFLLTLIVSKTSDASTAGQFFFLFNLVSLLAIVSQLGFDVSLVRYNAIAFNNKEKLEQSQNYKTALYRSMAFCLLAIGVLLAGFNLFPEQLNQTQSPMYAIILCLLCIPFLVLAQTNSRVLQACRKVVSSLFALQLGVSMLMVIFVFALDYIGQQNINNLMTALLLASIGVAVISSANWLGSDQYQTSAFVLNKKMVSSAKQVWVGSIFTNVLQWGSLVIAGFFISTAEIGLLAAAQRTSLLIGFVLITINFVVAPMFASLYKERQMLKLQNLSRLACRANVGLAIVPVIICTLFPEFVMKFFGEEFLAAAPLLVVLSLGQLVNVATGSVGFLLLMSGHERTMKYITISSGTVSICLLVTLCQMFGVIGAAWAMAIGMAIQNLAALYFVKRYLGFFPIG